MNPEIQDIIQEQFKSLPKVIQETILDSKWQDKIRRIVKVNNLHVDQGAAIENLVLITMLGIEIPEDFVKNAKEYAKVNDEQAQNISAQVEREIFGDIRKKLIETTDAVGTIGEIEQATNELDKVAAEIEKQAKNTPAPISSTKPSLKEKIPANYFDKNYEASTPSASVSTVTPTVPPTQAEQVPEAVREETPALEPQSQPEPEIIPETIPEIETAPEPIVIEPKEIPQEAPIELNETNIDSVIPEVSEEVQIETPKEDPYREEIEPEDIKLTPAKIQKPIFTPMPKNLDDTMINSPSETPDLITDTPVTAKVDPYREPIE